MKKWRGEVRNRGARVAARSAGRSKVILVSSADKAPEARTLQIIIQIIIIIIITIIIIIIIIIFSFL